MVSLRTVGVPGIVVLHALISSQPVAAITVQLEVTQGIQYFGHPTEGNNSINLVAKRPTAMRAKVDGVPYGKTISQVTPTLTITGLTPLPDPENLSEFRDFLNKSIPWDRGDTNSTLNYRIESLGTGTQAFKIHIKLDFTDGSFSAAEGNATLTVVAVKPLKIKLVPITFTSRSGVVFSAPKKDEPEVQELEVQMIDLVEGCFPFVVPDTDFLWQTEIGVTEHPDKGCASMLDDVKNTGEIDAVLEKLSTTHYGGEKYVLVYGLVSGKPGGATIGDSSCLPVLGWAHCDKRSAFGTAIPEWSAKAFAHEIGHLLQLEHCDACVDATEPCGMDGQIPFDVRTMTAQPFRTQSFMTCGPVPGTDVWATPNNYKTLLKSLTDDPNDIKPCTGDRKKEPRQKNLKGGHNRNK